MISEIALMLMLKTSVYVIFESFLNNEWSNKIIDMKKKCAWLWLHFKFIAFLAVNSNNSRLTGLIVCPFYTLNLNDFSFLWAWFDSALYFSKQGLVRGGARGKSTPIEIWQWVRRTLPQSNNRSWKAHKRSKFTKLSKKRTKPENLMWW